MLIIISFSFNLTAIEIYTSCIFGKIFIDKNIQLKFLTATGAYTIKKIVYSGRSQRFIFKIFIILLAFIALIYCSPVDNTFVITSCLWMLLSILSFKIYVIISFCT